MRKGFLVCAIGLAALFSGSPARAADRIFIADQTVDAGATGILLPIRVDTSQVRHGFSVGLQYDQTKIKVYDPKEYADGSAEQTALISQMFTGTASQVVLTPGEGWQGGQVFNADGKLHWGVVLDIKNPIDHTIPIGDNQIVMYFRIDILATTATTTTITPKDDLGTPAGGWSNILSYKGDPPTHPTLVAGTITINPVSTGKQFVRGDCNDDGGVDISDAIFSLGFQFLGGEAPKCKAACNTDASSGLDLTDAIYLLNFKFLGGTPPPEPFPACGGNAPAEDTPQGCMEFIKC